MLNLNALTTRQRNIASVYMLATDLDILSGMKWYANANELCQMLGIRYGYTTHQVCGVMAAISPGCSWQANVTYTERLLNAHKDGLSMDECPKVGSYGKANKVKAWAIADCTSPLDVLGGNKVRAFYTCLVAPHNSYSVCIDRHAASIVEGKPLGDEFAKVCNTDKKYAAVSKDYIVVAEAFDILPSQLQAITWVAWRRIHNGVVDSFM